MPTAHSLPARDRQPPRAAALKAQSKLVVRPCFMTIPSGLYRILITRVQELQQSHDSLTAQNEHLLWENSLLEHQLEHMHMLADMDVADSDDDMDESE